MALSVVSVTHTTFSSDATSHAVSMPATVAAGELLVAFVAFDGAPTITQPTGWSTIINAPSTNVRGTCLAKIADGTEGGTTVDLVTATAEQAAAQVYRIQGNVEAVVASSIEFATVQSSAALAATTIDPNAVTPSWGASPATLYIAFLQTSATSTLVSGPSGWGTVVSTNDGGGTAAATVYTSVLGPDTTGSANAGVWTMSGTGWPYVASTIAIRTRVGTLGQPLNTVAGVQTAASSVAIAVPAVAAGRVLLIPASGRRASVSLAPDDPSISDTSGSPLTWTQVWAGGSLPSQVGVNPGVKTQWWWAISDGNAHSPVTITWTNASIIFSSVTDFAIGSGLTPDFSNQAWASSTGTPSGAVTATYPTTPTTGIHFIEFYGAGGSTSTIATGYVSLTSVASTPYRTGYDVTPVGNNTAVMGAGFLDQVLAAVNIIDGGGTSTSATTNVATVSVGTVTVTIVNAADNIQVTGFGLECGTIGYPALDYITVRTTFGTTLGGTMLRNQATTVNPYTSMFHQATVQAGDLVYSVMTERTDLTVTGVSDNLGNTYTPANSGSDVGSITGRAFYSIVTNPGTIFTMSAAVTASNNDNIFVSQAFQGPFAGIDANPANVTGDIVTPYNGAPSGTTTQAEELLVAWAVRNDSVNLVAVAPLLSSGSASLSGSLRTLISRQVLSSTTTVTPQWTSSTDPTAFLSGTTTFKMAFGVSVSLTGQSVTASVGNETVSTPIGSAQTVTITNTADDGYTWKNNDADPPQWDDTWVEHIDYVGDDYKERFGLRFPGFSIPTGQQVVTATLTLHLQYAKPTGYLYGVAADTAPVFDDTNNPFDVPKTGASTKLNLDHDISYTPVLNVRTIINEIIGRGGWASGNAIGFVSGGPFTVPENAQYIGLLDVNDGPGSTLAIEWEPAPLNIANPYSNVAVVSVGTVRVSISDGTMDFLVLENSDDGYATGDIGDYFDQFTILQGRNASNVIQLLALRFQSIPIPQGTLIVSATLYLYGATGTGGGTGTGQYGYLKGDDQDNCGPWVPHVHTPHSIALTSAVTELWGNGAFNYENTYNVTAIVQEIVNRSGWLPNNALGIVGAEPMDGPDPSWLGGGWIYFQDSSNDPKIYQPKLHIAWGLGSAVSISVNVTGQSVTVSVGNETVNTGSTANIVTTVLTASVGNETVNVGYSVSLSNTTALTASVGNESVTTTSTATVNLTTNLITASVGGVSVSAGGNLSVTVGGNQINASVGDVTVVIPKSVTLTTTTALTASVGNESVAIGATANVTTNLMTVSLGTAIGASITNTTVEVFGQEIFAVSFFNAFASIGVNVAVTGQSMTVSRGTVVGSISKDVDVTGQSVTISTKVPTFITNHFITVHAPVITVSLGQAISPNWGALGPGVPVETWTNVGSGSSETWTPVPGSTSTPNNWT